ncbi:MAG: hypothetical protein ISS90_00925, partial [Candidatus Omnitrophica bacterium]|nr:hypothetical protein [Candidatus Omnitrophota bacterium]
PESARTALLTMLENRRINATNATTFMDDLVDEADGNEGIKKRIEKCLRNVYSLVQSLGRELEIMKEFWTYA